MKWLVHSSYVKPKQVGLMYEPRDLWIGIYWNYRKSFKGKWLEVYICLVPCLPVQFRIWKSGA